MGKGWLKKRIAARKEGEPIDTPKAEGEAEPVEGETDAEEMETAPDGPNAEAKDEIPRDAIGRRMFEKHEEERLKHQTETARDNAILNIVDGVEARAALYGVNEKGETKLQPHHQFVVRCKCGHVHTFCDDWPIHQENRLRKFVCPNAECRFTIPFKVGAQREYDPKFCKHVDEEIKEWISAKKAKTTE